MPCALDSCHRCRATNEVRPVTTAFPLALRLMQQRRVHAGGRYRRSHCFCFPRRQLPSVTRAVTVAVTSPAHLPCLALLLPVEGDRRGKGQRGVGRYTRDSMRSLWVRQALWMCATCARYGRGAELCATGRCRLACTSALLPLPLWVTPS